MLFKQQAARWVSTCWVINHQPTAVLCSSRAENTAPNGKIHVLAELIKTPLASTTGRVEIVFFWIKKFSIQSWDDPKRAWLVCLFGYKQVKTVRVISTAGFSIAAIVCGFTTWEKWSSSSLVLVHWGRSRASKQSVPTMKQRRGGITSTPGLAGFSLKLT